MVSDLAKSRILEDGFTDLKDRLMKAMVGVKRDKDIQDVRYHNPLIFLHTYRWLKILKSRWLKIMKIIWRSLRKGLMKLWVRMNALKLKT